MYAPFYSVYSHIQRAHSHRSEDSKKEEKAVDIAGPLPEKLMLCLSSPMNNQNLFFLHEK